MARHRAENTSVVMICSPPGTLWGVATSDCLRLPAGADARRGAAPYGDASQALREAKTLILRPEMSDPRRLPMSKNVALFEICPAHTFPQRPPTVHHPSTTHPSKTPLFDGFELPHARTPPKGVAIPGPPHV